MNFEQEFVDLFARIAPHYRRSELLYDFITLFALEFYLILYKDKSDKALDEKYRYAVKRYTEEERKQLSKLFVLVVEALEQKSYDFLGTVFMNLDLGDQYRAQFFTPTPVARTMAEIVLNQCDRLIKQRGFITLQEPTCGSGVMVIESYNFLARQGFNPQQNMWVQARDIDFTAAMMCYIQMVLLNIPGEVIIGDTLMDDVHYHLYTPAHLMGNWSNRLTVLDSEPVIENVETETVQELPFEIDLETETVFY